VNGPTVLVVEDDQSVQTTLCATLALVGYTPYKASTVDGALHILATRHVDAVILDVSLPDSTGLARTGLTLLPSLPATPVLIFTGKHLSSDDAAVARQHRLPCFTNRNRIPC
jgi:DNA-binding response OmpR family regulator